MVNLILVLLIGALSLLYIFLKRIYSYWERNGFKTYPGVSFLFGHFKETLCQKESMGHFFTRVYRTTNEPFLGVYGFMRPLLLINDPELVQTIFIKDFAHFSDRNVHCSEYDPLSMHLFALSGPKWKNLRAKLTPAFTSGRLKSMFSTITDCGITLQKYLDDLVSNNKVLDVREISACYLINCVAGIGFGFEIDTITQPNHEFREMLRKVFQSSFLNSIRFFGKFIAPKLLSVVHLRTIDKEVEDFIMSIVKQNLEYREQNGVVRKDFFQLLVQLRNSGAVELDDQWETVIKGDESQKSLTLNEMAAQAFIFLAAGFETSSTTLSYCLYELAKHPEYQKRVHDEIDQVLSEHDGKLTYESISEMKFLEKCLDETLRKYPILPMLNRTCVKEYHIPGTNQVIEKGVEVYIPVLGIQRDEKYFIEPNRFNPDRWSGGNVNDTGRKVPNLTFGDGPRNCIGMRLGKLQTKIGICLLLQRFRYELDEPNNKDSDMEFDPRHFLLQPRNNIYLRVLKR